MTQIELVKVLNVIAKADGCSLMGVKKLMTDFVAYFPFEADEVYAYIQRKRQQNFTPFKYFEDSDVKEILGAK